MSTCYSYQHNLQKSYWQSSSPLIQRCVVVTRQVDGYGLSVTGDHPVYVYHVKPDGAAYRAGVRKGDRILKVNGMPVTASNHFEVVRMISGGQTVALTLLGLPQEPLPAEYRAAVDMRNFERPVIHSALADEGLREKCVHGAQLERALKRIEGLQSQLKNFEQLPRERTWIDENMIPAVHGSNILLMEEETDDDEEVSLPIEPQGPFSNLTDLKSHPAYLAAFISYLLTNANPSSLFFYLITDSYQNSGGNSKELRKWAYEIFSAFLIPNAPLSWNNIDQSIIQNIDKVLAATVQPADTDADQLRHLFSVARNRALDDINEHLADFRQKRRIGLGSLFDANQLAHISKGDTAMEARVGETILIRALENMLNSVNQDLENCDAHSLAIISALATVIKVVLNMRSNTSDKIIDRCPTFVTKDKGGVFKMKMAPKRSIQVKGHQFLLSPVNLTVYCYQCRDAVWGVNAQAYFCQNCDVVIHKQCTATLIDHCYPATQKKGAALKSKRPGSLGKSDDENAPWDYLSYVLSSTASTSEKGITRHQTEYRKENGPPAAGSHQQSDAYEKPVLRSQSLRVQDEDIREMRKGRPVLSWGVDQAPPEETEETDQKDHADDSGEKIASASSSRTEFNVATASSSASHNLSTVDDGKTVTENNDKSNTVDGDSDLEVESEIPPLESFVSWEVIRHLKPKEKKRQEVINELFHTERTHVRNLKILLTVFYKPMLTQNIVPPELVKLFFSNIEELSLRKMRAAVEEWKRNPQQNGLFGEVGALMENMFEGDAGTRLMNATATFCQHQQHALDILRQRCKKEKDDQFVKFLAEAESNSLCRKLQLKDMLPVEMQRLVKYPLLLETVAKYTNEPSDDQTRIMNSVNAARRILSAVNTAKKNAENLRRLEELQQRLDTAPYDKENFGSDFNSMNLTNYKLVYDGPLTWRFSKGKMVELYVVLLEEVLVLLTKIGDGQKLVLKSQETSKDTRWTPILPLAPLIAKEKANDKRAFFIVNAVERGAQIYELVASTATERKNWFKAISDQIEAVKKDDNAATPQAAVAEKFDFSQSSGEMSRSTEESSHLQRVHVLTHPQLVNASEITVQQPTVLERAQPVLTPTERLRRNDEIITRALLDKNKILSEFLPGLNKGHVEELEKLTEQLTGMSVGDLKQRDGRELAMSAIVHGNRLLDAINQGLSAKKRTGDSDNESPQLKLDNVESDVPSVACYKLTGIAAPLMNHLKAMMQIVQDQHNQISALKQELSHYKGIVDSVVGSRTLGDEAVVEHATTNSVSDTVTNNRNK
uniref:Guanine nucleotide exchange factor n=1 Tax=Syphacia muris TaxID=451379 RepID=A0A158R527_9BILA